MTDPNDPAFAGNLKEWVVPGALLDKYPELVKELQAVIMSYRGLTKREYFAAMAMQGINSNGIAIAEIAQAAGANPEVACGTIAQMSLMQADALIAELNKEKS